MSEPTYDAVIVGAGVCGAIVAKVLTEAGKRVLILEAGRATGLADEFRSYQAYQSYAEYYQQQLMKIPNSPYPPNPSAPSPYATDNIPIEPGTPDLKGYWVQHGPDPFMSSNLRQEGGTTLHWMGSCPRMLPNDFDIATRYGVGRDWPITYDDLQDYYALCEWEMGVAANVEDQQFLGLHFRPGYNYPMYGLPQSYQDQVLGGYIDGRTVDLCHTPVELEVRPLAVARNSPPRQFRKDDVGPGRLPPRSGYQPVSAVGAPTVGLRCEGNSSCTPICPVQAKYSALKTLAALDPKLATIQTQSVVTKVIVGENGRITGVEYIPYEGEGTAMPSKTVSGTVVVLAGHAVENAKILLASGAANSSDQVGRNLMDHPYFMTWALARENLGVFRGPGYTSGIQGFRDGAFRDQVAAFRIDIGNWGWNFSANAPFQNVTDLVNAGVFGSDLRQQLGDTVPRQIRLGFQIEQLPEPGNRVTISRKYKNPGTGEFRPVIDYKVSDYTLDSMIAAIEISNHIWNAMGIPEDDRYHLDAAWAPTLRPYRGTEIAFFGAGHIAGTHRLGSSRTDSVVNDKQRSWDHDNLYVVGCGSMPTIATGNPTLTATALTWRSADDMLERFP